MNRIFGNIFKANDGSEYGVIRETEPPFPDDLSRFEVIAEDEDGNYFIKVAGEIHFWDHEIGKTEAIATSIEEFIAGCIAPQELKIEPDQVKSVWVDPEFAKQFGIDPKP